MKTGIMKIRTHKHATNLFEFAPAPQPDLHTLLETAAANATPEMRPSRRKLSLVPPARPRLSVPDRLTASGSRPYR